jgi:hypothetical protein
VRGKFDWGVLNEKMTHKNTDIEMPIWISVLPVSYRVIIESVPWLM